MKLIAIIKKEIMAVKSQRISILLILLYPLLGTLLLGLAMTGGNFDTATNINIGVINNNSTLINDISNNANNYTFINYNNTDELKDAVSKKQITIGLEIIENTNSQSKANIYYDNSSMASAGIFTSMIKTNIDNVAKEKTITAISEILTTTNLLSTNVTSELNKLEEFKQNLRNTEILLNNLEIKINSFDINDLQTDINEQKENIEIFREKNTKLKSILVSTRTEFNKLKFTIEQINSNIANYSNELNALENQLILQETNLNNILIQLESIASSIPNSIKNTYLEQLNGLSFISTQISNWKNIIIGVNNLIDSTNNTQSNLNNTINNFDTILSDLEKESAEIDEALLSSEEGIAKLESKLGLFEETLLQARQLISESRTSKENIEIQINESIKLFDELLPKIESFKDMAPTLLIQPIEIKLIPTQINSKLSWSLINIDATQLGVMVSNSISIILILTCILLTGIIILSEKNQDIPLRTHMSQTSQITLTIGKLIGQVIIAIIETIIIILVAIIVFGFPLSTNFINLFLAIILVAASFVSIGLIIGAYTKNQSTTILLSLLIIIPMLFVSGIIVPLELMPNFVSILAELLPLTAANNLLIGVIVKSGNLYFIWKEVIVLITIIIIGILLTIIKKQ